MMLAIGTGIALTPDSVLERMTAKVGIPVDKRAPGAASIALWLTVGGAAVAAHAHAAQMAAGQAAATSPVGDDENWLVRNIVCQCGSCRHMLIECASENCGHAIQDRLEIRRLLDQKQSRDQIIEYFIKKYGSQIALASPIDKGFNRLAWLLPYSLGTLAVGGMVYGAYRLARRSTRRRGSGAATCGLGEDQEIVDKLEDELRNLD